jgi:hypothetical protein
MRNLFILLLIIILWEAYGQDTIKTETSDTTTLEKFYVVDKPAEFPEGMVKFYGTYISKNIRYPKDGRSKE